jgi:hypothetical protein
MTRGRKPLIALREAEAIGTQRGTVLLTPGRREDYFDLIVCEDRITIFVRVKRSITHISDPRQVLATYRREIIRLRSIPLTAVVVRELWVRSPRGSWQFFRLSVEQVVEIRRDGTIIPGAAHNMALIRPMARFVPAATTPVAPNEDVSPPATRKCPPVTGDPECSSPGR